MSSVLTSGFWYTALEPRMHKSEERNRAKDIFVLIQFVTVLIFVPFFSANRSASVAIACFVSLLQPP